MISTLKRHRGEVFIVVTVLLAVLLSSAALLVPTRADAVTKNACPAAGAVNTVSGVTYVCGRTVTDPKLGWRKVAGPKGDTGAPGKDGTVCLAGYKLDEIRVKLTAPEALISALDAAEEAEIDARSLYTEKQMAWTEAVADLVGLPVDATNAEKADALDAVNAAHDALITAEAVLTGAEEDVRNAEDALEDATKDRVIAVCSKDVPAPKPTSTPPTPTAMPSPTASVSPSSTAIPSLSAAGLPGAALLGKKW